MIVHEERTPIWHKSRVLVSFLAVFLMFPSSPLEGGFLGLYGRRAHDHWASRFGHRRDHRLLLFFRGFGLVRDGQPVEVCLSLRNASGDLTVRLYCPSRSFAMTTVFGSSTAGGLFENRGCRGGFVDIARVTVVGMIVVFANDRALSDGVIVQVVECLGASLVIAIVVNTAPMANSPPASAFGSSAGHVETVVGGGGRSVDRAA